MLRIVAALAAVGSMVGEGAAQDPVRVVATLQSLYRFVQLRLFEIIILLAKS